MQRGTARLRHLAPATLGTLGALAAAGAVTGCTASGGDESMLVLKNVLPADDCKFTPAVTETGITHGALDVQAGTGYLFTAQIKSRVTADTGQEDQRTILVSGANVDITFPGSTLFSDAELAQLKTDALIHFKSLFSSALTPNGGLLDAQFELIPPELVARIASKPGFTSVTALATFKVIGAFPGDDGEQTSQAYQYPVTILSHGLINDKGLCSALSSSFTPRVGNSCNPGQDFQVDCCTTATGLVCPAVGTGA